MTSEATAHNGVSLGRGQGFWPRGRSAVDAFTAVAVDRNRSATPATLPFGADVTYRREPDMLCVGAAIFGISLPTVFRHPLEVYSAAEENRPCLPAADRRNHRWGSGRRRPAHPRAGPRPRDGGLITTGRVAGTGSRLGEHSSYAGGGYRPDGGNCVGSPARSFLRSPQLPCPGSRRRGEETGGSRSLRKPFSRSAARVAGRVRHVAWTVVANRHHRSGRPRSGRRAQPVPARPAGEPAPRIYTTPGRRFSRAFWSRPASCCRRIMRSCDPVRRAIRAGPVLNHPPRTPTRIKHRYHMEENRNSHHRGHRFTGSAGNFWRRPTPRVPHVNAVVRHQPIVRQGQSDCRTEQARSAVLEAGGVRSQMAVLSGLGPHSNAGAGLRRRGMCRRDVAAMCCRRPRGSKLSARRRLAP